MHSTTKGHNNGGGGSWRGGGVACCILHVAHFTASSSYDKRYGKRQQCRTHVPRHCQSVSVSLSLRLCLLLCYPCYPSCPPLPLSSTVCDPLNFVCCLWRKKMRLSILATCKNFISCAAATSPSSVLTLTHTHTHTYADTARSSHTLVTCHTAAEPPHAAFPLFSPSLTCRGFCKAFVCFAASGFVSNPFYG